MSYRCTNAFIFADRVFPGGMEVDDDHPILKTHAANFARVGEHVSAVEAASATPGVPRLVPSPVPEAEPAPEPVQELPKKRGRPKKQVGSPAPAPVEPEGNDDDA